MREISETGSVHSVDAKSTTLTDTTSARARVIGGPVLIDVSMIKPGEVFSFSDQGNVEVYATVTGEEH